MSVRSHARARRLLVSGLVVLGLLTSGCEFDGAYDLPLPGSVVKEEDAFRVTVDFQDVLNVVPRSPVMVDDVAVGEVVEVERVGWHARLTLRIRKDVELPDNAIAEIRQTSLLGEKYVALEPPPRGRASADRLGEGDTIPLSATGRNPEVEEVLGALSFLLTGGGVGQLGTITRELNKVMSGRTDRLQNLLGELDSVVGTLDDQKADIIRAMDSLNGLAATLNAERDTIGDALDVMGPAVAVLAAQHEDLMAMLKALDELGVVGTRVIGASKDNLVEMLRDLQPVLTKLNEAGDSLPRGLSLLVSFPFPKQASEVVKGDFANTEIKLDISLDNFGLGENPVLPELPLPDPGELLAGVTKCLSSGSLTSPACAKVLADANLLDLLVQECRKNANKDKVVCGPLATLPLPAEGSEGLLPGLIGGLGLRQSLVSGAADDAGGAGLFGEGLR